MVSLKTIFVKKVILLLLALFLFNCKKEKVDGIIIGDTLLVHQTLTENRKLENLIYKALNKEKNAFIELKNFPNGGAASSYDFGYVLTQIIYRIGEKDFVDILRRVPKSDRYEFDGLIAVGLEYGDNDYDGKMDNKRIETEFPKLKEVLNE